MYIFAEHITPRLQYIVQQLLPRAVLTSSVKDFSAQTGAKLNYSHRKFSDGEILVRPQGMLEQTGIRKQPVGFGEWKGLKIFFMTGGDIPFDIFAAAFYLLSRYEEYLPHQKDSYGRFAHEESLAFKNGFLQQPLVNIWLSAFGQVLMEKFDYRLPKNEFRFTPTYDIDIAYAGKGRGLLHRLANVVRRRETKINGRDAFDVYDWLDELHKEYQLNPRFFILLAKARSEYDKNLRPGSPELRGLVQRLARRYPVGIHPSWQSHDNDELLKREIRVLDQITGIKTTSSRQHYIRFTLPHTFRCLIEAGITDDYSMGYGSINGFRASYCQPYYWYDLLREEQTSLLLHPFCYMEANSFFEQKLGSGEAAAELKYYYHQVKEAGGELITIFHNHFLTEEAQWQPWRQMYLDFLSWHSQHAARELTSLSLQEQ